MEAIVDILLKSVFSLYVLLYVLIIIVATCLAIKWVWSNFIQKPVKETSLWRLELIDIYQKQISYATPFMKLVLSEAIYKLRNSNIHPKQIEDWVVKLERTWLYGYKTK